MIDKPKHIYAIYPYDENGNVAGVYVGITENVSRRIKMHLNDKNAGQRQKEMHELMRKNGFSFQELGTCTTLEENYREYDWIQFFKSCGLKMFNFREGNRADAKRCGNVFWHPHWTGRGVTWQSDTI